MEPFIGQISMFGGNFAPRGWAFCDGQLLPINQNQALFSLLGTTYGGDGRTTFALPELRGRVPMHAGNGPGLTPRQLGQKSGQERVTLNSTELPQHNHPININVSTEPGEEGNANSFIANHQGGFNEDPSANKFLSGGSSGMTGGNQSHNNMQPYQSVNFIIALVGIFPSRS